MWCETRLMIIIFMNIHLATGWQIYELLFVSFFNNTLKANSCFYEHIAWLGCLNTANDIQYVV